MAGFFASGIGARPSLMTFLQVIRPDSLRLNQVRAPGRSRPGPCAGYRGPGRPGPGARIRVPVALGRCLCLCPPGGRCLCPWSQTPAQPVRWPGGMRPGRPGAQLVHGAVAVGRGPWAVMRWPSTWWPGPRIARPGPWTDPHPPRGQKNGPGLGLRGFMPYFTRYVLHETVFVRGFT